MQQLTVSTKLNEIKREWHLIDVDGLVLGREATRIAALLMGKAKPYFVHNLDCGDYVVIINAKNVKLTGKKEANKSYYRHSGYPGGFKAETVRELRSRRPEAIIRNAVSGMLPQNKLRDRMLKRLLVFAGNEHKYEDKFVSKTKEIN